MNTMTEPTRESGDMRAAFEAWAEGQYYGLGIDVDGSYSSAITHHAWLAYQAAIATTQRDLDAARVDREAMAEAAAELSVLKENANKLTASLRSLELQLIASTAYANAENSGPFQSVWQIQNSHLRDIINTALKEPSA